MTPSILGWMFPRQRSRSVSGFDRPSGDGFNLGDEGGSQTGDNSQAGRCLPASNSPMPAPGVAVTVVIYQNDGSRRPPKLPRHLI